MTASARDRIELRYWERLLIALLGWMLVTVGGAPVVQIASSVIGWAIIAAAVGAVEVAMALYYRARRRLT